MPNLKDIYEVFIARERLYREWEEIQEQQLRESNRRWQEIMHPIKNLESTLNHQIGEMLIDLFDSMGVGVRQADGVKYGDSLIEVFLGSDDGVKRYQSKVSCHISFTYPHSSRDAPVTIITGMKSVTASVKFRNELDEDIDLPLPMSYTVAFVERKVRDLYRKGFWNISKQR